MARASEPAYSDSLAFLLSQVGARSAHVFAGALADAGVSPRQFGVLSNLETIGGQSQQAVADALGVHRNNMVGLVDELESAGWVERRRSSVDRRAFELHLTPAGRAAVRRVLRRLPAVESHLTSALSEGDRTELRRLLQAVAESLGLRPGVHPHLSSNR